jgi:2-polyprenyl-3-methyl-5-hydroxy-6-metoxy-1,4-benzoquinol methylase
MANEKVDFDKYADDYDALLDQQLNFFSEDVDYYAQYKVNIVVEALVKNSELPPKRILEFGCGTGRNLLSFKKQYPDAEITGYDISEKSIEVAKESVKDANLTTDLHDLLDNYYDLIFIAGVFHHIEPSLRKSVTNKVLHCLNPDGNVFVFEHNPFNPVTRKMVRECPFDEDAVLLKSSEMRKMLSTAGLRILALKYTLFFPPNFVKKSERLDKLFTWLPLGGQYYVSARK